MGLSLKYMSVILDGVSTESKICENLFNLVSGTLAVSSCNLFDL